MDEAEWDDDSAFGSSEQGSITTSLSSYMMDYRHENGRRYHAFRDGSYLIPNDDEELQRLDLQHNQWRLILDGGLFVAPLPNPLPTPFEVLDIGTGTGIWAIEFADEHPNATVTGVDLSPVQPNFVPPNCHFFVDDIEYDWVYGTKKFDFIHARFLSMGIRDWPQLFRQSFDALNPGGWVEYQEAELYYDCDPNSPKPNPMMKALSDDVNTAALQIGVNARQASTWKRDLEEIGFVNHEMRHIIWPLGDWHPDRKLSMIGRMNRLNMLNAVEALSLGYLVRIKGDPLEEVKARLEKVKAELRDPDVHSYMNLYLHVAQKPL